MGAAGDGCLIVAFFASKSAAAATPLKAVAAVAAATDCREAVAAATGEGFALTGGLGFLMGGACNVKPQRILDLQTLHVCWKLLKCMQPRDGLHSITVAISAGTSAVP